MKFQSIPLDLFLGSGGSVDFYLRGKTKRGAVTVRGNEPKRTEGLSAFLNQPRKWQAAFKLTAMKTVIAIQKNLPAQ